MPETFDSSGSVDDLIVALEAPAPSPAGGTAAALTAAMAASLVAMVARGSRDWPDGATVAQEAVALRLRLLTLAGDDVRAFAAVLSAPRGTDAFAAALVHAAEIPLEIADRAADVTELAQRTATHGKRPLQADAEIAALLAETATRAAASLVRVNLAAVHRDHPGHRLLEAAELAQSRARILPKGESLKRR